MQQNEKKPITWPDVRALCRSLGALELQAGVLEPLAKARWGPGYGPDLLLDSPRSLLDEKYEPVARYVARQLYFGVEDTALRTELIRKQREFERAYRAVYDDAIAEARKEVSAAEGLELPGAVIGVQAGACALAGAFAFGILGTLAEALGLHLTDLTNLGIYGALAGALFGFFFGQQQLDRARAARTEAIRMARARLEGELETKREEYKATRSWFTYSEEQSGHRADAIGAQGDIETAARRRAAYDTLAQRTGDFEVFQRQSNARLGWEALLTPEQIANFGMSDDFEPISNEQYLTGLEKVKREAMPPQEDG